jgi:gamma-glutamylcyclotransferase (GGCT)/AIG2-like uncharacterized protein YtfP
MAKTEKVENHDRKRYLFSYGTLLPRLAPPEMKPTVRRLRRVGRGSIRGRLFDFGDYPGAVLTRTGSQIVGQIFELPNDPEVLSRLDEYEGFDRRDPRASLFVRKRCVVKLESGEKIPCWVYTYNRPLKRARLLTNGDYTKRRARRSQNPTG